MAGRIRAFLLGEGGRKAFIDETQWVRSTIPGFIQDAYGSSMGFPDGSFSDYLSIYRTQPAVRQVIDFRAKNIAQVGLKEFERVADADRRHVEGSAFEAFLQSPHPELTYFEFMRDLVTDLDIFDVTFWAIVETGGKVGALRRIFPDSVTLIGGDTIAPETIRETHSDGTYTDWKRSQVFILHGYGSRRGISPMETLKTLLAEETATTRSRAGLFKNGLRNAGVIERPLEAPDWSEKARKNFLDSLADRYAGGANAGKPLLLEEGMTWKSDAIDLKQVEYVAGRELAAKMVAREYGMSPQVMGLEPAPYASIEAYNAMLYQNNLAPALDFIGQGFQKWLLPYFQKAGSKTYVEFNLEEKLRGSFEAQATILTQAVGGPWLTVNEARAMRNLPAIDGGDELLTGGGGIQASDTPPAAEAVGGSQSPAEPAADQTPAEAPKTAQKAAGDTQRALLRRRDRYASSIEEVVAQTFDRMATRAAKSADGFKADTFKRELQKDVRPVFERITAAEGARKAAQRGGEWDPDQVQHYLDKGSDLFSRNVVDSGAQTIADHAKDEPGSDALKVALAAIAARVALGQATHLASFAREEAGRQTGAKTKTWSVTSSNSRHPELDGESAKLGAAFSNGLAYPGDPSGDPDQTAGCECVLDIT